jgi:hypothetical protein
MCLKFSSCKETAVVAIVITDIHLLSAHRPLFDKKYYCILQTHTRGDTEIMN